MNRLCKALILFAPVALVLAATSPPKYVPLDFDRMALTADLVVHGEIVELEQDFFVLEVETLLVGELPKAADKPQRLKVRRFHNWTCAYRWVQYETGQEVLLFLEQENDEAKTLRIMSAGGEGEMPVVTRTDKEGRKVERVIVRGSATDFLGESENHEACGGKLRGVETAFSQLIEAIRGVHRCFSIEAPADPVDGPGELNLRVQQLVDEDQVEKLKASSKLARQLVKRALELAG